MSHSKVKFTKDIRVNGVVLPAGEFHLVPSGVADEFSKHVASRLDGLDGEEHKLTRDVPGETEVIAEVKASKKAPAKKTKPSKKKGA